MLPIEGPFDVLQLFRFLLKLHIFLRDIHSLGLQFLHPSEHFVLLLLDRALLVHNFVSHYHALLHIDLVQAVVPLLNLLRRLRSFRQIIVGLSVRRLRFFFRLGAVERE